MAASEIPETTDDPRMTERYVRTVPGDDDGAGGDVVLIGVVHDHPASVFRVRRIVESVDPDVLALELPPLALPLFEAYADDRRTPPPLGGEMSAAIQAASRSGTPTQVAAVDGPSPAFAGRLLAELYRESASRETAATTLRGLVRVTRHAVTCRLAAVASRGPVTLEVDGAHAYEVCHDDEPAVQAADEHRQISKATTALRAFGSTPATRLRDRTREAHMAEGIAARLRDGDVVAVVGLDHLESLEDRLTDRLADRGT